MHSQSTPGLELRLHDASQSWTQDGAQVHGRRDAGEPEEMEGDTIPGACRGQSRASMDADQPWTQEEARVYGLGHTIRGNRHRPGIHQNNSTVTVYEVVTVA